VLSYGRDLRLCLVGLIERTIVVSKSIIGPPGAAINARVAPVAFSEHHRSRNARSRRLPWSVVPDRNADAPRAELRDDRTGAGVDQPAASGQ
jgi:hypothetical protein